MNTVLHITRAFIFLVLASFASTALSVTVGSESGGASMDGTWSHGGCREPDHFEPETPFDTDAYQVWQGNTVEVWHFVFPSSDGSCSGVGTVETELYAFDVVENFESPGWLGEDDQPALPPECQDPSACPDPDSLLDGKLDPNPMVTSVEYVISPTKSEFDVLYIDDTALTWYLYRDAGEDDAPSKFMSIFEPLIKTDLVLSPIPIPAAFWLFGTALIGFVGVSRRRKVA